MTGQAYHRRHRCDLASDENATSDVNLSVGIKLRSKSDVNNVKKAELDLQNVHPNVSSKRSTIDLDVKELVAYLRQPEALHHRGAWSSRTPFEAQRLKSRIMRPFEYAPAIDDSKLFVPIYLRDVKLLSDDEILDFEPLEKEIPRSVDYPPFFGECELEKRLDNDDYEGICLAMLQDEISRIVDRKSPTFEKNLELQEKEEQLNAFDRLLYYIFGFDRSGYFSLLQERNEFIDRPWARFLQDNDSATAAEH
ncbi:LAFA_0E05908g1_1 [Lachancea sp. 'fantastica']|nr:LAFA_0E05908g1_1 [Lachancea sp. 'fantastica']